MSKLLYRNDLTQSVAMICDGTYMVVDKNGTVSDTYATLEELLSKNPEFLDWSVSRDLTA